jgi:ribose transport system permease protein
MLTSGLIDGDPARVVPVVAAVLLIGTLIGALNGALTVLLRVHPLIVTIGMASVLQGAGLLYSLNPPGSVPLEFEAFAYGRVAGVPIAGAIMLALFLAVGIFLRSSRLGRQIYAVGGDPFAARLIGIPHDKVIIVAYALSGLFAALTAVYLVSRLGIGDPWAGQGWALRSITPVVVGGTLLAGGRGGVSGTLLGVFLISLLNNLLNYLDVSTYYQWIIQGLIIIVAVSVYVERRRRA